MTVIILSGRALTYGPTIWPIVCVASDAKTGMNFIYACNAKYMEIRSTLKTDAFCLLLVPKYIRINRDFFYIC